MTNVLRGRYETLAVVGRGGQGEVVLAVDRQHDRRVAIKIRPVRSEAEREALLREARVLFGLRPHAGLPLVREDFFDHDRYHIVMDWIDGVSLSEVLAGYPGGLPFEDALAYLWQIAVALDHLHGHDPPIVHQDVKPGNVIRTPDGRIVLVDFGLSRATLGPGDRYAGSPGFAAPELSTVASPTPAADVYGLAATAFVLLTGHPPDGDLPASIPLPDERSDQTIKVMRTGLSIDPERRQSSATQFVREFARAGGRPVPETSRPILSGRSSAVLLVVVAVAATVVGAMALSFGRTSIDRPVPPDTVGVFSADGERSGGTVALGSAADGATWGFSSLWVLADGRLLRIDPVRRTIANLIELGAGGTAMAAGAGSVWVTNADGRSLLRVDPTANAVVESITVGNSPSGVAVANGSVWVADRLDNTALRLDEATGKVIATISVGEGPVAVAAGHASIWIVNASGGTLTQISPTVNAVIATINVGRDPGSVATSHDAVWVGNRADRSLSRIDPSTGRQTVTDLGFAPSAIAALGDAVWVADATGGRIVRVDPASGAVAGTINLGTPPRGLVLAGGGLLVATGTSTAAHRGGTLRAVTSAPEIAGLDPALDYEGGPDPLGQTAIFLTGDRLVSYGHVAGGLGKTLVPDLATSIPAPADGGRTYTFLLRPEIHFSNGALVTTADVMRSFERTYRLPSLTVRDLGPQLLGASRCPGSGCDLSLGIRIDEATRTITFRLSRPDPDFLYRLASPWFTIVPASTPEPGSTGQAPIEPIPGTGPYMIAAVDASAATIRLVRNPFFAERPGSARPDGFPDEIDLRGRIGADQVVGMIESGDADVSLDGVPIGQLAKVRASSRSQIHESTLAATLSFFLNTRVAPFDDVRVRRALNLAVDRKRLAAVAPGGLDHPTCQVLPPNYPAYRPYCPYTLDAGDGSWTAPDLAAARALVKASGTVGMAIVVWTSGHPHTGHDPAVDAAQEMVVALDALGYQASVHEVAGYFENYLPAILDPGSQVQIGTQTWAADFLNPQDFFQLFMCDDPKNAAHFCDRGIDAAIRHAADVQLSNPAASIALWAEIEPAVDDLAPWLPYANPGIADLVGARVGNVEWHWQDGVLLDQLWVQ